MKISYDGLARYGLKDDTKQKRTDLHPSAGTVNFFILDNFFAAT